MTANDAARALLDLLDRERRMILDGDLNDLNRIAIEKERLSKGLSGLSDPRIMVDLRAASHRNAALLDAAAAGIRDAIARVREIRTQAGRLSTYTQAGQRQAHVTASSKLERRA